MSEEMLVLVRIYMNSAYGKHNKSNCVGFLSFVTWWLSRSILTIFDEAGYHPTDDIGLLKITSKSDNIL